MSILDILQPSLHIKEVRHLVDVPWQVLSHLLIAYKEILDMQQLHIYKSLQLVLLLKNLIVLLV